MDTSDEDEAEPSAEAKEGERLKPCQEAADKECILVRYLPQEQSQNGEAAASY